MSVLSQFIAAGGLSIKSIQRGTIAMGGNASADATITSVDTTKSLLFNLGVNSSADSMIEGAIRLQLVNGTTVRGLRSTGSGSGLSAATVGWQVVEFE
jgi:hypothetical protein